MADEIFRVENQAGTAYVQVDGSGNLTVSGTISSASATPDDFGTTGIKADVIAESTSAAGVTVDGLLIKDSGLVPMYLTTQPSTSTAAAGTTTSDAVLLPTGGMVYPTTGADDTKGVRVHDSDKTTGRMIMVGNGVSNKILKVYPPTGGTINGAAADAAFSSASGMGVILVCLSSGSNTWLAW